MDLILEAISGYDADTKEAKKYKEDYTKYIDENSVKGLKVAIVKPLGSRNEEIDILNKIRKEFKDMGAKVIETKFSDEVNNIEMSKALEIGFKYDVDKYLEMAKVEGINELKDIVEFNKKDLGNRAPYGQELLEKSLEDKTSTGEPIGVTFVGSKFQEGKLIKIANIYEDNTKHRKNPNLK